MRKLILTAVALVVVTIVIVNYMETGNATVVQWANLPLFNQILIAFLFASSNTRSIHRAMSKRFQAGQQLCGHRMVVVTPQVFPQNGHWPVPPI